jgi:hypothetical protein
MMYAKECLEQQSNVGQMGSAYPLIAKRLLVKIILTVSLISRVKEPIIS